jgi:hypothetical protein
VRNVLVGLPPAALAAALALSAPEAGAAGIAECDEYVAAAIQAAHEVQSRGGCGFDTNHPQWSTDPDVHKRWCRASNQESVDEESANRKGQLNLCRKCDGYAAQAVETVNAVLDYGCGYDLDNPRWSTDRNVHRQWCMAARDESVDLETARRGVHRMECRLCRDYSADALSALSVMSKNKCSFDPSSPRWSGDGNAHFSWCMRNIPSSTGGFGRVTGEKDERTKLAGACSVATATRGLSKSAEPNVTQPKVRKTKIPRDGGAVQQRTSTAKAADPCKAAPESCRKPRGSASSGTSKIVAPGLLEGGAGSTRQGPSAAGSPTGGGATTGSGGAGSGTLDYGRGGGAPRGGSGGLR